MSKTTTDTERFEATAREIANGYGYLCADRMNDANILQFADIISSALSAAFEDGRKAGAEQERAVWELSRINQELGIE